MKKNIIHIIIYILALVLAVSCSEKYEIKKAASEITYLAVESIISDIPSVQTVKLTESLPYTGKGTVKGVSGAIVTVTDQETNTSVRFTENPESPGEYCSPDMYCGVLGHTYDLKIERNTEDGPQTYEASSTMRNFGLNVEKIDYKYTPSLVDSMWTVGAWGADDSGKDNYLILPMVNGYPYPITSALPLGDHYFSGAVVAGYPIMVLYQSWEAVKMYGPCAKPLETGDIVSLVVYDMPEDFHEFMFSLFESSSAVSIPIISSQPANLPSNMKGKNVVGYFSTCPCRIFSCVVDDPYRTKFLDEIAAGL